MTSLSGVACVLGASVICVDLIIRQFPGKRDFRIQDSDAFLSMSLSLSFGVMLFSALYSMLPSAKSSLQAGGLTPKQAAWTLILCFLGGVLGIQVISRVMHHFMPSHVVDCEHSHEEEEGPKENGHAHGHEHDHEHVSERPTRPQRPRKSSLPGHTPLGPKTKGANQRQTSYFNGNAVGGSFAPTLETEGSTLSQTTSHPVPSQPQRRPSLQQRLTAGLSSITSAQKPKCDCDGPCYGFTDVCGSDCFKNVNNRGGSRAPVRSSSGAGRPPVSKSASTLTGRPSEATPLLQGIAEEPRTSPPYSRHHSEAAAYNASNQAMANGNDNGEESSDSHETTTQTLTGEETELHKVHSHETQSSHNPDHHHHHVPANAFLSIGLQTSIAIALHKLPEGFITYATNHANPKLGVSVFLALFIHNITEGFAMALPLYLAINSRVKAMTWSFVLGGLSQPVGAGVAALWFKIAGTGNWAPDEKVYGGMFAVTAGIMASVALQLFSEALDLTHSRGLCMVGAFIGMGVLGISSALTA